MNRVSSSRRQSDVKWEVAADLKGCQRFFPIPTTKKPDQGPYAPQGSTSLLPKLSVTSKVSARTSYALVGSRVHFRSSEDVTLLEFTSPIDRE